MLRSIRHWWKRRHMAPEVTEDEQLYTRDEVLRSMAKARQLGYSDGKRDGLAIAREQATKSLKEILWEQNKATKTK